MATIICLAEHLVFAWPLCGRARNSAFGPLRTEQTSSFRPKVFDNESEKAAQADVALIGVPLVVG